MYYTVDHEVGIAYIYLTGRPVHGEVISIELPVPPGSNSWMVADWVEGKIIGIEVSGLSCFFPDALQPVSE